MHGIAQTSCGIHHNIPVSGYAVDQVLIDEAEGPYLCTLIRGNALLLSGLQVHKDNVHGLQRVHFLHPRHMPVGIGRHKTILRDLFLYNLVCLVLHIDLIQAVVQHEVQQIIRAHIRKDFHIPLHKFIRFGGRKEKFFFQHILFTVIVVYTGPGVSLMFSPVHITIEHKIHISVLLHTHDFKVMHGVIVSVIRVPAFPEAENLRHLIGTGIVGPQVPLLYKGQNTSRLAGCKLDILRCDTQIDLARGH